MIPSEVIADAERTQSRLAGDTLTPDIAKLYSQYTRLRFLRPGLSNWSTADHHSRLTDAVSLVDAGLILREAKNPDRSRACLRRAGELLEWLAPPVAPDMETPYRLLSAASYQLAGYPARANAVLKAPFASAGFSEVLRSLLRGHVTETFERIANYWTMSPRGDEQEKLGSYTDLGRVVIDDTIAALGITVAFLRWGHRDRLESAVEKLDAVRRVLVRDTDRYSWLLARLIAAFAADLTKTSFRTLLSGWLTTMGTDGQQALERYLRVSFLAGRCQAWPSQQAGIARLAEPGSFALCTPTGSGKTSVAELAILQSLFTASVVPDRPEPIAVYLVPSRALAAEVEGKLTRVFRRLSARRVIVTGLYGGTDWGPTDAWLTSPDPAVLICTYEKGEALMRFLGPHFLSRVALVILDEAHSVRFTGDFDQLRTADSRAFRLESLGMRLLRLLENNKARVIALSAVATDIEQPLQAWVTRASNTAPVTTDYRSTRQLIGRLMFSKARNYEIRHDLLDRARLHLATGGDTPFIPSPIPPCPAAPDWDRGGPEKSMRPALLWAALHLTSDGQGGQRGVLVSLTEQPLPTAKDWIKLLDETWINVTLPTFFTAPTSTDDISLFERCRMACADVFGVDSAEYLLLEKGIVLHHGKMPPVLGRLLVNLVEQGLVNVVVATSTLSEGVNLPLETVLVPSLRRGQNQMSATEFANLAGRAGRPGVSSEGQTLVLLRQNENDDRQAWQRYRSLLTELQSPPVLGTGPSPSALRELLNYVWSRWQTLSGTTDRNVFHDWLEKTAGTPPETTGGPPPDTAAFDALDTLDSLLLSAVVEYEEAPDTATAEDHLQRLWQHSFAAQVGATADQRDIFIRRGGAIPTNLYPNKARRRSLYSTGLPPRSGAALLDLLPALTAAAQGGENYATWQHNQRLEYITRIVELIGQIDRFHYPAKAGKKNVDWRAVLAWWVDPVNRPGDPGADHRATWYKYADTNFRYLFSWGIGSFIGVVTATTRAAPTTEWQLDDWLSTGLPWAIFWLKELVTWGSLDPVAAYLVAKGLAPTRVRAQELAKGYYTSTNAASVPDPLDPRPIRRWVEEQFVPQSSDLPATGVRKISVKNTEDFSEVVQLRWPVLPCLCDGGVSWVDPAGYGLAEGGVADQVVHLSINEYDFTLDHSKHIVEVLKYL